MTPPCDRVLAAIRGAWSAASSTRWRPDAPATGQCSVTALLVQEILGGRLLKTPVEGAWHFYNEIDGQRLDLTDGQFARPIRYEDRPAEPAEALADTSSPQLAALRAATLETLAR
jgi:hypothetical protein